MSGLFQPSDFWIAARRMLSWRFLVALLIIAGCFELVARAAPRIVGKQVHQRYVYSQRACGPECLDPDRSLRWVTNGSGARGKLFRGESIRIAVVGSSTTANTLLDQDEVWTERLRELLGPRVHVDNFARDGAADPESTTILRHLSAEGLRYDLVLVMTHIASDNVAVRQEEASAFWFWSDWEIEGSPLAFPSTLRRRALRQLEQEPRVNSVVTRILRGNSPPEAPGHNPLDPANRELRRQGLVTLVDYESELSPEEEAEIRSRARGLVEAAREVAPRVWVIRQPVAYDEGEVAGVADRWLTLSQVPGAPDTYLSNRSLAERIRRRTAVMADAAEGAGATVLDLDEVMRPLLAERADLFRDKWHFSPAGAELAAQILAGELHDEVAALSASEAGRSPDGSTSSPPR